MTPSKAQMKILMRIAGGTCLQFMSGFHAYAYFPGDSGKKVNYRSVFALEDKGFIKRINEDWKGFEYILTKSGRQLITEHYRKEEQ